MRSRWSIELDPCQENRKTVVREDWSAAVFHFDKKLHELSIVLIWKLEKRKTEKKHVNLNSVLPFALWILVNTQEFLIVH